MSVVVLSSGVTAVATAHPTRAAVSSPGSYPNALIATTALKYVGQWGGNACADAHRSGETASTAVGTYPTYPAGYSPANPPTATSNIDPANGGDGQCRSFANCIVWMASNKTQWIGLAPSDYFYAFTHPSGGPPGTEITTVADLKEGDIVQQGQTTNAANLHTYVIVKPMGGSSFDVVDSNFAHNEFVREHTITVTLGSTVKAFRMGTVQPLSTGGGAPRLGSPWGQNQTGYGQMRPSTIYNGGDPTGLVQHIHWTNWGKSIAVGSGESTYVWPGTAVGDNAPIFGARVVAFRLATCKGYPSYNAIEWYFPKYDQTFNPHVYINACTGKYAGQSVSKTVHCADVPVAGGSGTATEVEVFGMSCANVRQLITHAPVASYIMDGGRFMQSGFRCGTMGAGSLGEALFDCAFGDREFLYSVAP